MLEALEWVADNHRAYDIRVVNISLGHPVYEPASRDPLVRAAEALVRRGIVVVASAGNMGINPATGLVGYGGVTSPANGQGLIAVGAVDNQDTDARSDDKVTNYSSRGPTRFDFFLKPDIVASGHQVVSLSAPGSTLFETYPALHVHGGNGSGRRLHDPQRHEHGGAGRRRRGRTGARNQLRPVVARRPCAARVHVAGHAGRQRC